MGVTMADIPLSYKGIAPSADLLFLSLHRDTAAAVLAEGFIPTFGDLMARHDLVHLGVGRINEAKASRRLPRPWDGTVSDFVTLDLTPCTRSAFASITGQTGASRVERQNLVSLCVRHDALRLLGTPLVYTDRLCTRNDARFSGDRDTLLAADWRRIQGRDFRPDTADPGAVHRYDASVLAWGAIPTALVEAVVCKDEAAADEFRVRCRTMSAEAVTRPDLLW